MVLAGVVLVSVGLRLVGADCPGSSGAALLAEGRREAAWLAGLGLAWLLLPRRWRRAALLALLPPHLLASAAVALGVPLSLPSLAIAATPFVLVAAVWARWGA